MIWHFTIFIILLIPAVLIGAWRHFCSFLEADNPINIPLLWRSQLARITTLALSFILSFLCAWEIKVAFPGWIGNFFFGAILMFRWQLSGILGAARFKHETKHRSNL